MDLINSNKLEYNIGIDAGDNITNILFNYNTILPNNKNISFIIPEIDEEYIIKILIGNNILAEDNRVLDIITIHTDNKKIFIDMYVNFYLFIHIETKNKTIYKNIININNYNIDYINKEIDINNYKIKFELCQVVNIIRKKIKMNYIILDDEEKIHIENKLNLLMNNINTFTNQKMLDIKTLLKTNFFID